jgi:hypothetical protein
MAFANAVVAASMRPLPSVSVTLARLCNFRVSDFQTRATRNRTRVHGLRIALAAGREPVAAASLDGPRLSAAASLAAWSDVMTTADEAERSSLAERSLRLIRTSGPPGTRASAALVDATGVAADIVSSLLAAGSDQLEA